MSQENVEVVRRAYEALNRGDLDGMVADFAPEFEFVPTGAVPGAGSCIRGGPTVGGSLWTGSGASSTTPGRRSTG